MCQILLHHDCIIHTVVNKDFCATHTIGIQEQWANMCKTQKSITIIHIDTAKELIGFAKTADKLKQKKDNWYG